MKSLKEWKVETNQDSDVLLDKLESLFLQVEQELKTYQGERFDGFLNLLGVVSEARRTLAEVSNGLNEDCGEPHAPKKMKKINKKEVVSKGVRCGSKDLSGDYKGHLGRNGDEEPFKVMK